MTTNPRTYGGWRRSRGIGLLGLGLGGTLTLLGAVLVVIVAAQISPALLVWVGPPTGVVVLAAVVRFGGEPIGMFVVQRVRWWIGRMRGYTKYRSGILVEHPRAWNLPGVLAPVSLVSADDGLGSSYGVVWNRRTGEFTATLLVAPASIWLADPDEVDGWVARWGAWLARLGYMPYVRHVAVTVETAPEPGSTLADQVYASLDPQSPPAARHIMDELVQSAPAAAAEVHTRVSITFAPHGFPSRPKKLDEVLVEIGHSLTQLESSLNGCGVTVVGRATATQIVGIVRSAYDPLARGAINRALSDEHPDPLLEGKTPRPDDHGVQWHDAVPIGARETPGYYEHDSGISVSWGWNEAPRQIVQSHVLSPLLAPTRHHKRVTLLFRAYPAGEASRLLEAEVNAAHFRRALRQAQGRDATARDAVDEARARQAAADEAAGAGVTRCSMYVTVTVTDQGDLPRAIAQTEADAETSKIRLRRLWHSQSTGFATTLPCGIYPPDLAYELSK